jgi:hypothetical protein
LSNSYYNLNERRKGDGGVAKKQPVDPPQQRQYSSYRDSILGTSAPAPAPAPASTAAPPPPPPPPLAPPPTLGPPTRRRSSVARSKEQLNELLPLSEVQRLVRDTLRKTSDSQAAATSPTSPTTRSERIAEMVATAVGQAVVKAVTALGEHQGDEVTRLEEENDRLIAVVRGGTQNVAMKLGPKGRALEAQGRKGAYPYPRTIVGALRHCAKGDSEPFVEHYTSLATHCKSLRKENTFLRTLTEDLRVEANRRRGVLEGQIATLKEVLSQHGIAYSSPQKSVAAPSSSSAAAPPPPASTAPAPHYMVPTDSSSQHQSHPGTPPKDTTALNALLDTALDSGRNGRKGSPPRSFSSPKGRSPASQAVTAKSFEHVRRMDAATLRSMAKERAKQVQNFLVEERRQKAIGGTALGGNRKLMAKAFTPAEASTLLQARLGLAGGAHASKRGGNGSEAADLSTSLIPMTVSDPYFRDKPEMVDILLRAPAIEEPEAAEAGGERATPHYMSGTKTHTGKRVPTTPGRKKNAVVGQAVPTTRSHGRRSPKPAGADEEKEDAYDRFVRERRQRPYAQQHLVPAGERRQHKRDKAANSPKKKTVSRRQTAISESKKIELLKKSRKEYGVRSRDWAKNKEEEKRMRAYLEGLFSANREVELPSKEDLDMYHSKLEEVENRLSDGVESHRRNRSFLQLKSNVLVPERSQGAPRNIPKESVAPSWIVERADEEPQQRRG